MWRAINSPTRGKAVKNPPFSGSIMAKKASERSTSALAAARRREGGGGAAGEKRAKADEDTKRQPSCDLPPSPHPYPMAMGILQSGVLRLQAGGRAALFPDIFFTLNKVYTQMFISMVCIAPVVALCSAFLQPEPALGQGDADRPVHVLTIFNPHIFHLGDPGGGVRVALPDRRPTSSI